MIFNLFIMILLILQLYQVDGWSSGVVLFQLAGHDHPIKAKTIDELKKFEIIL